MKSFLFIILTTTSVWAQSVPRFTHPNAPISVEALRADIRVLRATLEELHPSLYRYTPKKTLDSSFYATFAGLQFPITEQEFVNRLYPLVSQIRCGHTQIEHSKAFKQTPNRPQAVPLPFQVLTQDNRLFIVQNNSSDARLETGAEILSVNGISTDQLIHEARQHWSSDGFNQTWVEFFINFYEGAILEDVATFVHGWRGTYTLQVRHINGNIGTTTVMALPPSRPSDTALVRQQIMPVKPARSRWNPKPHLNLRLLPDSATAVLTVNALEYGDETFYQQAFAHLQQKRVQNLVLDIRRNHGGDARIVSQLLAYLADGPFVLIKQVEGPVANPERSRFRPYFDKEIMDSHRTSFASGVRQSGVYQFNFRPENGRITGYLPVAKSNRFLGKLFVLIDGGTFSNGANFAAALKAQRANVKFIGRETGGTEAGCNGGTVQRLTLPHSGVVVQFPWLRLVSASLDSDTGHGLLPDVPVMLTPRALANGRDEDLEAALKLVAKATE